LVQHATLPEAAPYKTMKHIQHDIVATGCKVISDSEESCKTLAKQSKPNARSGPALTLQKQDQETSRLLKSPALQDTKNKPVQSQRRKFVGHEHEGSIVNGCRAPLDDDRHIQDAATETENCPGISKGSEYQSRLPGIPDDNQQSRRFCALSEPDEPTLTGLQHMQHTWPVNYEISTLLDTAARRNGAAPEPGRHGLPKNMQNGTGK
jgi:hypothetical protein